MIDQLSTTLRALAALPSDALNGPASDRLAGDCADALRLELDCPQQSLTPAQRAVLTRLSNLLEDGTRSAETLRPAVRAACVALEFPL